MIIVCCLNVYAPPPNAIFQFKLSLNSNQTKKNKTKKTMKTNEQAPLISLVKIRRLNKWLSVVIGRHTIAIAFGMFEFGGNNVSFVCWYRSNEYIRWQVESMRMSDSSLESARIKCEKATCAISRSHNQNLNINVDSIRIKFRCFHYGYRYGCCGYVGNWVARSLVVCVFTCVCLWDWFFSRFLWQFCGLR